MKLIVCLIGAFALAHADPGVIGPQDARKPRNPASGPTNYNTISPPDSETLSKLQNQVAPTVQIPIKPPTTAKVPEAASPFITVPPPSAVPSPFLRQAPQAIAAAPQGQYYVAMLPQSAGNHMLAPATTPLIMQYINPQGQPTGGLQYIQLLRPVVYPYGNQQQYQPYQQLQQQQQQQQYSTGYLQQPQSIGSSTGPLAPTAYNVSPTPPPTTTTTQPGFVPFQPASSLQQPVTQYSPVSHIHPQHPSYSSGPIGQYSSPVLSYYPHRFLVNPSELNFNTNEYIPSSGDGVYLKGVKTMRA